MKDFFELREARVKSDDAFLQLKKAGAKNIRTTSDAIIWNVPGKPEQKLRHRDMPDGHRYVAGNELKKALKLTGRIRPADFKR